MKRSLYLNRVFAQKSCGNVQKVLARKECFSTLSYQAYEDGKDLDPNFVKPIEDEANTNVFNVNPYADVEKYKILNLKEDEIPDILLRDKKKWYFPENREEFLQLKYDIENLVKQDDTALLQHLKDNTSYTPLDRIIDILAQERDEEIKLLSDAEQDTKLDDIMEDPELALNWLREENMAETIEAPALETESSLKIAYDKDFRNFMKNPRDAVAALTDSAFTLDDIKKISQELRNMYPKLSFKRFLETFVGQPPTFERAHLKLAVRGVSKPNSSRRQLRRVIRRESPLANRMMKLWMWRFMRYKNPDKLKKLNVVQASMKGKIQVAESVVSTPPNEGQERITDYTVDNVLLNKVMQYEFYPNFVEVFDDVRMNDPLVNKLESHITQINSLNQEINDQQKQLPTSKKDENSSGVNIEETIGSLKEKLQKKQSIAKTIEQQIEDTVDVLVLKMRVKYIAKEYGISLPLIVNVETVTKPKEDVKKSIPRELSPNSVYTTGGHLVSYIDESGRKVMFEVPKTDLVKSFRQKPGRSPLVPNRRNWKGKDYALEQVTDAEGIRIRAHFKYEKDYKQSKKFPFELGPHVMDEWKVYERYQKRKAEKLENPDFSDSLILRKAALMNNAVDMTLNRAVQLAVDAWRKRYVPTEKSDKFTKVLECLAREWSILSSQNPESERQLMHDQAKARFRQYMYRQVITKFLKEVINQNLSAMKVGDSSANDAITISREVDHISAKLEAVGIDTDEMREIISVAGYRFVEAPWFGEQFALLREMLDHLDDIIELQVEKLTSNEIKENIQDQKAILEQHIANVCSLMYLHGGRLSDVRTAFQIHKLIKQSTNIGNVQKREVRELFRLCFREYELFAKPVRKQIFDQF